MAATTPTVSWPGIRGNWDEISRTQTDFGAHIMYLGDEFTLVDMAKFN